VRVVDDAAFLADFGGALSSGDTAEKMAILTEKNIEVRLALSLEQIKKELQLSRIQQDIGKKVEEKVRKAHEDHMLREQLKAGFGNLSTKNRLRDRFSSSNLDRLLDRNFQGRIPERTAEQNFKTGDRILDRT
jgi:ATP-dependent Lon protease